MTIRKSYSQFALFSTAALWCLSNGFMHVVVPLYALYLGYSILEISSIVAVPVLVTLVFRFVGGAFSDRFGERGVLQGCYLLQTIAALILIGAGGYVSLIIVLIIANISRSTFWIPAQSLASQLAGSNVGKNLGQLSAANYSGTLLGQVLGGVLVAYFGYRASFFILSALGLACMLLSLALPASEAKPRGRTVWQITLGVGRFLRYPQTWLIISGSSGAALPLAISSSIYPLYLAYLHYGEQWIGVAVSLRAAGPIAIGLLFAALITPARQQAIYALGMVIMALGLIGSGLWEQYVLLTLCVVVMGAGGGVMDLLYQVQASALSHASNRSMAMASTGLGWNISPFLAPLIVGWLVDMWGFEVAFIAAGCFLLAVGAGTRLWFYLCGLDERALSEFVRKEYHPA